MDVVRGDPARGVRWTLTMEGWDSFGIDFLHEPAGDGATKVTWIDTGRAGAAPGM